MCEEGSVQVVGFEQDRLRPIGDKRHVVIALKRAFDSESSFRTVSGSCRYFQYRAGCAGSTEKASRPPDSRRLHV